MSTRKWLLLRNVFKPCSRAGVRETCNSKGENQREYVEGMSRACRGLCIYFYFIGTETVIYKLFMASPCPHGFGNKGHCLKQHRSLYPRVGRKFTCQREIFWGQSAGMERWEGVSKKKVENIRVRLRCTGVPLSRWGYYCCHCLPRHSPLLPQPQWHQCPILSTPLSSSGSCQAWVEGCGLTSAGWQGLTMGLGICHRLGSLWLEICRDKAFWNPGCCLISIEEIILLESKDDWKTTSSVHMSIMPTAKSSSKVGLLQMYLFLRKAFPNSPYCSSDKAFEPAE